MLPWIPCVHLHLKKNPIDFRRLCWTQSFILYVRYLRTQNHRIAEAGRHFWGSSCPTPPLKQGHYSRLLMPMSIRVLNISKEADPTTSVGDLCQCSTILTVKRFLLMIKWNFLHLNLCPLPLVHAALWSHPGIATDVRFICSILWSHKCRIIQAITQTVLCFMRYYPHFGYIISATEGHGVYWATTDFTDLTGSATKVWLFISQCFNPSLWLSNSQNVNSLKLQLSF